MKKHITLIVLSLLISLFIYVFYRTENTLVNKIIISIFSIDSYRVVKNSIISILVLNDYIIYSLPEGLWVFCITITSGFFYLELKNIRLSLVIIPLLLAIVMEFCQLFHFTNGRFDVIDIIFAIAFWLLALLVIGGNNAREPLFKTFDAKTVLCMCSYCIVYMAHVFY